MNKSLNKGLPIVWTQGIQDPKKKQEFEAAIRASTVALDRLYTIIDAYLEELENKEMTEDNFIEPDWATRQACIIGQKKSFRKVQYLLEGVARPND